MRQTVFLLYSDDTKLAADEISKNTFVNRKFFSVDNTLTVDILVEMASTCRGDSFFIIKSDTDLLFPNFDFSYIIPDWDREYLHIWDNDTSVRLLDVKNVLLSPEKYTDEQLNSGSVNIKNMNEKIISHPSFDIIFLSYDEMNADENYDNLKSRFPRSKRIHGVSGIYEAHKAAARIANTSMFYVVDADAEILNTFNFDYRPHSVDRQAVHVWHSLNPVNDLEYGYGGVKLFPTERLLIYSGAPLDFTTAVSTNFKIIEEVSNITKFNTDPFSAWRSGFRECAKLAAATISNQNAVDTTERLIAWTTKGSDREFGEFAIMGATAGKSFGYLNRNQPEILGLINNYKWLENQFTSQQ